jgi:glyoxylase-like metal-dependent hydrolase (beta-lactamase superfamily II)
MNRGLGKVVNVLTLGLILSSTSLVPRGQAQDFSRVEIRAEKLRDNIYVLFGAGGNMGMSVGDDGVFLIDDQFAPLTEKIKKTIATVSEQPVRFVVNTHFHFDHSGGNENLGKEGAVIVAHRNVRERMAKDQFVKAFNARTPAQPGVALPVVTFTEGVSLHLNGDEAIIRHIEHAHTDSDSLIYFKKANVIHMGDTFTNGPYPFVDVGNGGTIDGVIEAAKAGLAMADDETLIIPGHGQIATKADLDAHLTRVQITRDIIDKLKRTGISREDVIRAKPLDKYESTWGKANPNERWTDLYVGWVYDTL